MSGPAEYTPGGDGVDEVGGPPASRLGGWRAPRIARPGARVCALLGYLVAAFVLTLPAWSDPAMKWTGGPSDPMAYLEYLGWYPFAIGHGLNPLLNTYVNLPQGTNMMWDTTFPFAAVVLWPVTGLFGVIVSYNCAIVAGLTLDGWCTFLWLRRHVRHPVAAWVGGLMMVLGPYASTRAHGHMGLLLFFSVPLLFIATERVVSDPRHDHLRWGAAIGTLAAVQLLCWEETLTLFVIVVGSTLVISALLFPRAVKERIVPPAITLVVALAVFLTISAVPLAYQFLGPGRITGSIQGPNTFVTDVVNLVVPGWGTALQSQFTTALASHWTGGFMEADAYIGIPLLGMSLYTVIRWRRDRWLRVVGLGTAAALVWSLGPFLHVDGITHHLLPLPGRLLAHLPLLQDILPARFDLFMDLGLGAVIAIFVERAVLAGRWHGRLAAGAAVILVCVTLAPSLPISAYTTDTPRYFLPGGDVDALPLGTVALVVPYGDGLMSMDPMLWQAESGFRVRMVSGALYTAGPDGAPSFGKPDTTLGCAMNALQSSLAVESCGADVITAVRGEMDRLGVKVIIMGPMAYGTEPALKRPMETFLSGVAGTPPRTDEGALVWPYTP